MTDHSLTPETARVLGAVEHERCRQKAKWGPQHHADGTGRSSSRADADRYRELCNVRFANGRGSWLDILLEEVYEAAAETGAVELREELVQVAAVAVAWIEDIDSRAPREDHDRRLDEVREAAVDWPARG